MSDNPTKETVRLCPRITLTRSNGLVVYMDTWLGWRPIREMVVDGERTHLYFYGPWRWRGFRSPWRGLWSRSLETFRGTFTDAQLLSEGFTDKHLHIIWAARTNLAAARLQFSEERDRDLTHRQARAWLGYVRLG